MVGFTMVKLKKKKSTTPAEQGAGIVRVVLTCTGQGFKAVSAHEICWGEVWRRQLPSD